MARTTLNIETPILKEIKTLQNKEGLPMGKIISRLLSEALAKRKTGRVTTPSLRWVSRPMQATVNIADKDILYITLDTDNP
jgi:hypothetical protein